MSARGGRAWRVALAVAVAVNLVLLYWPRTAGPTDVPGLDKLVHAATFGSVANGCQTGSTSATSTGVGRLMTTPRAPSSSWSSRSTTERSKWESPRAGVATSSRPVSVAGAGAVTSP